MAAGALAAQSPIGDPFLVGSPGDSDRGFQAQTILASGELLVVWMDFPFREGGLDSLRGRRFSLHGPSGEEMILASIATADEDVFNPLVAPRPGGGFLMVFGRTGDPDREGCRAEAFSDAGEGLAQEFSITTTGGCGQGLVTLADGTFGVAVYERMGIDRQGKEYRLFGRLSSLGDLVSKPRRLNPTPRRVDGTVGRLAGNSQGEMAYVWNGNRPAEARFFSAFGGPLPPLTYVRFTDGEANPEAVVTPDGLRIFVGVNFVLPDSNYVAYQLFSRDGKPLTRVKPAMTPRDALFGDPVIAADRFGNFVLAWASMPTIFDDRVEARLFRSDGTPVGKEFFAGLVDGGDVRPQVSFADNGTFALSWVDDIGLEVAWFSASPGDEVCLARDGRLHCDTGRTGGEPEIDQPDAPSGGLPLFLADYDGDGRADPCFRSGTTFHCDLGHRGRGPNIRVRFGEPADVPLMGDVDGDGRAEACVRRGDLLLCDTAHDGASGEFTERFGSPTDLPLLGDVDGDHRADLCLFHDGTFACDLAHDGGAAELTVHFGQTGDLPVLGDFDGDGRADPCVLRGDTLLCDLKHDGGSVVGKLTLAVQPGDGIVMGNLDGL